MFTFLRRLLSATKASLSTAPGERLAPESRYVVTLDDQRIVCRLPSGKEESVAWDDLDAVIIETNDTGPFGSDVHWLLVGRRASSGCVVPQGATGEPELLEALQRLPGFDNEKLIDAMGCTDNQKFMCWKRGKQSEPQA